MARDVDAWLEMIWSDGQGLGKDSIGRQVTRKSGNVIWKDLSEWTWVVNMFVSQAIAY